MKKLFALFLVIISISCSNAQKNAFSKKALSETLLAADDTQIAFKDILKKHEGKTLVIEIWASWCGDCVKAMPQIKELQTANPEVDFLFLSADKTPDKWKIGIEKHSLQGDHYMINDGMNGVFGKAIDLNWIPRYIIVDKTGQIALYNAIETDFEKIKETLNKLK